MLRSDLACLDEHISAGALHGPSPWDRLYTWAASKLSTEGQEQLVSLLLEPYPELVDELADRMAAMEKEAGDDDDHDIAGATGQ